MAFNSRSASGFLEARSSDTSRWGGGVCVTVTVVVVVVVSFCFTIDFLPSCHVRIRKSSECVDVYEAKS
ncbi:hypothetical protein OUZ56_028348 [Daphnia magna]|uniref:Transmembrane protein n=1 Tax=Daphnia magna TaxID=35525 RepID=A0ABR0B465_9CRUS|nr:hypothetical protein OUZ56_028348 [Daphnia magna]